MPKFTLPRPIQRPSALREEGGGDHSPPSMPRRKTRDQRMQEELADVRAQEEAANQPLAPGNVKLLRTWENLAGWERQLIEAEVDARQRARARLDAFGPDPISDLELFYGAPEKFHG